MDGLNIPNSKPSDILKNYKLHVEAQIAKFMCSVGAETPLTKACEYALLNGGKRLRPSIVLMVSEALGHGLDASFAALCVEFFHTASLIADDLPCMDDDDMRRDKPATHKVFGETLALLSSYALISAGYQCIHDNTLVMCQSPQFSASCDRSCVLALESASYNTGIQGTTGGQFLDIYPESLDINGLREVLHKKTGTLYEISFVLGWLFGGGDHSQLSAVKKISQHFGLAFQIADDFGDVEQDKINKRLVNVVNVLGVEEASSLFHSELEAFRSGLEGLNLSSPPLLSLYDLLEKEVEKYTSAV